ncbi:MAG: cobalamin-dependent protein [Actinobacteria bacterium]|nr:cobalamin-dependent protein [Actinomycetota bacterium]
MPALVEPRIPRVLLAKPGLDGHDRGVKVVGMALRDAGIEVIYLGLRQSVGSILSAAQQEDVDVIGLSVLSGVHLAVTRRLLSERDTLGLADIPVVVGGTIPPADADLLREMGAAAVFPVGIDLQEMVASVKELAAESRGVDR